MPNWNERAALAQQSLQRYFWNEHIEMFNIEYPCPNGECNTIFHYWWMAHAVEVLVDGYERSQDSNFLVLLEQLHNGLYTKNNNKWTNELYDDMQWMAIAWLRVYQITNERKYLDTVLTLWSDIKTGWNDFEHGGIAWQKSQLDYKNTPANAPAVILAARLYKLLGLKEDLEWAHRIFNWLDEHLVDPATGFVWDGMNREGNHQIDKDWEFTYCQGVYIGAACELYTITNESMYLAKAHRTALIALHKLTDPSTKLLQDEGLGDGGLFKGIFIRYMAQLVTLDEANQQQYRDQLIYNGEQLWHNASSERGIFFAADWAKSSEDITQLSAQLSGIILSESLAFIGTRAI